MVSLSFIIHHTRSSPELLAAYLSVHIEILLPETSVIQKSDYDMGDTILLSLADTTLDNVRHLECPVIGVYLISRTGCNITMC